MTIEEMSLKAYPGNKVRLQKVCYGEIQRQAYLKGAKAVLEEIEDIVYRRYSDDGDPNQKNKDLIKLIQQLKG